MTRKTMKPRVGRPPIPENERRSWNLNVRAREDQRDAWHRASTIAGVELSDIVRAYLDRWARKIIGRKD